MSARTCAPPCESPGEVRQSAKREIVAVTQYVKHYADPEHIENSDEVCLGICMTVWLALIVWFGAFLFTTFTVAPNFSPAAELKHNMGPHSPEEVFAACQKAGGILANFSCFRKEAKEFLGNNDTKATLAFMELDCNHDFDLEKTEFAGPGLRCPSMDDHAYESTSTTTLPTTTTITATITTITTATPDSSGKTEEHSNHEAHDGSFKEHVHEEHNADEHSREPSHKEEEHSGQEGEGEQSHLTSTHQPPTSTVGISTTTTAATPKVGPLTLDEYRSHWGNLGEHAIVQVVVQRLLFDSLDAEQLESIRSSFVENFAQAAGVKPSDVTDMDGNALGISLAGQGSMSSQSLMGNCGIVLPFGLVASDIAQALRKESTRKGIAESISQVKGIEKKISGGTLHADDIDIEAEKNGQDIFSQSDQDISGTLDASEFKQASDRYMTQPLTQEQSDLVFSALDMNHDGQLSDSEFFAVSRGQTAGEPTLTVT